MVSCPICKSKNVAKIFWGYPANPDSLRESIDSGKIILGGCCISGDDPKWSCNECGNRFGRR